MSIPIVSVITVVYNAEPLIQKTLQSLANQSFNEFELLIIDGKSSDNTLGCVEKMKDDFRCLRILSEKDRGIYDAMNKGISMAQGEYIYFLNAGDVLYNSNVFNEVSKFFDGNSIVYGDAYTLNDSGKVTNYRCGYFSKYRLAMENMCHQSIFYPSRLLKDNIFDLKYRLSADCVINMSLWRKTHFVYANTPIILYEGGGASDREMDQEFRKDRRRLVYRYLGIDAWCYIAVMKLLKQLKLR